MLIQGTGGAMSKAYFMCSGSEAMESAMKLARQYYMELSPQQPKRVNFIAREGSYHEVMSGMGRSGTLHAWQHEDVIPDIQTIAKGLGGGYAPMAGMLINHRVAKVLGDGTGYVSTTLRAHNKTADGIKELSLMGTPIKATQLGVLQH
ncbi:aminotransferase [Colletotrichum higginsianum]|uniref:Aminotransferase n=1 Tax=Colletotrichum higginsianum (strain IMI 349063) TaxID=759273 RepID=H1VAC2_COLHI|nr:aminotransferase [Colletotrichum higginsianum]